MKTQNYKNDMKKSKSLLAVAIQRGCLTKILPVGVALAAVGTAHAALLGYESFGNGVNNTVFSTGYQSTTLGYSQGLSGSWTVLQDQSAQLKNRTSSTGWTGAQNNLTSIGSSYSLMNGGAFHFLEAQNTWNLEIADVALGSSIDMTQNGTWYMSFVSSAPDFGNAASVGLNNGANELMWGNGYAGGGQGVTAYYGAMSSFTSGPSVKGTSGITPTMANPYDVVLYVAQLQQVVGTGLTVSMYAYDLNTVTGLPSDVSSAGTALWSTTLTGVNDNFDHLEVKVAEGGGAYPSVGQIRVGTTWGDAVMAVPEPSSLAMFGCGLLGLFAVSRKRK